MEEALNLIFHSTVKQLSWMLPCSKALIFLMHVKAACAALARLNCWKVRWKWMCIGDWKKKKLKKDSFSLASLTQKQKKLWLISILNDQRMKKIFFPLLLGLISFTSNTQLTKEQQT